MTTTDGLRLTEEFSPRQASAVHPLVEERTTIAWRMIGGDPNISTDQTLQRITTSFDLVAEVAWRPGRSTLMTEVAKDPDTGDLDVVFRLGMMGGRGTTVAEAEALADRVVRLVDQPPFAAERIDPGVLTAWVDAGDPAISLHAAHVRQHNWHVGDATDLVAVVSRFLPTLEPWRDVVRTVAAAEEPLRVRATMLATELSPHDQLELSCALDRVRLLQESSPSREIRFDLERAEATLLDLRASLSTPCYVCEVAIISPGDLPETLVRSVAAAFTSEGDVLRKQGQVFVAANHLVRGGFEIDRDPPFWEDAIRIGLPLRGGIIPRDLSDLITLFESPIGWPVPTGSPIPGIPGVLPSRRVQTSFLPDEVDASLLGYDPTGSPVKLAVDRRCRHVVVTGTWGAGKSTAMASMARDDLERGRPFLWIDPHGTTADHLAGWAAEFDTDPLIIGCVDGASPRLSVIERLDGSPEHLERFEKAAGRLSDAIASSLPDPKWTGPRWHQVFHGLLALASVQGGELLDAAVWAGDQKALASLLKDPALPALYRGSLQPLTLSPDGAEVLHWTASKLHALVSGNVRRILAPAGDGIDLGAAISEGRTIIASLAGLSQAEASFVGHLLLETVLAEKLAGTPSTDVFTCFVDEAHRFPAKSMSSVVVEGRKFLLGLVLATQSIHQLPSDLSDLVAAVDTHIAFRSTPDTAAFLAPVIDVSVREMTSLPDLQGILAVRGQSSVAVNFDVMEPPPVPHVKQELEVLATPLSKTKSGARGRTESALDRAMWDLAEEKFGTVGRAGRSQQGSA